MKKITVILCMILLFLAACSNEDNSDTSTEKEKVQTEVSNNKELSTEQEDIINSAPSYCDDKIKASKCDESVSSPVKEVPVNKCGERVGKNKPKCMGPIEEPTPTPQVFIPGNDILSLGIEEELILVSQDNGSFAELKVKHLSRGEVTITINVFRPEKRAMVILYGNWKGDKFVITDFLGKEEMNILDLYVTPDKKQVVVAERTNKEDVKWVFTQVENEEVANAIHNGEMEFPF